MSGVNARGKQPMDTFKAVVDKMRLSVVVRLSRSFWNDALNDTEKDKRQFVLRQLAAMTSRCR